MKIIVQRAKNAKVVVAGKTVGKIEHGLLLLVGITHTDQASDLQYCAKKVANLRIFSDDAGKMNLSVKDVGGGILSISQFTLYGDASHGNRPSYTEAARPEVAEPLYDEFNEILRTAYGIEVATGAFGADMAVCFTNDGPVTLVIETAGSGCKN